MKVMKQTAVEWLSDNLWLLKEQMANKEITIGQYTLTRVKLLEQAKEMEKEQIIETSKNSYIAGYLDNQAKVDDSSNFPEDYYNETFNTNEK
jgi:hypothetical protein